MDSNMLASEIDHFIFDLDGTLTQKTHDFGELRRLIAAPLDTDIIEFVNAQSSALRRSLFNKIELWERQHALKASAQIDAQLLLESLQQQEIPRAILTRNTRSLIEPTLRAAGLWSYFSDQLCLGREDAAAKPSADGILLICRRWQVSPNRVVMIGDHGHDLSAGKAAGVTTVHINVDGGPRWQKVTDYEISGLSMLVSDQRSLTVCAKTKGGQ